eukprot:Tamp_15866.p1 GENE.Tamp_15866~~Tamp_15866.p1  ORF type:complete len:477 (+),score=187.51 Tamp_15866:69-1433(+)
MADDGGASLTPKAPRELRQKLKNGEITEEEFERQRLAIKTSAAKARLSVDTASEGAAPDAPPTPGALARQFSEMMDPEVKNLLSKVKLGKEKEVKEIIGRNPAILKDAFDVQGNSVLHLAALNGHKRIVKEVLRNADRFDPYVLNKKGFTAVDLARDFNYPELAEYIREKLPGIKEATAAAPGTEKAENLKQDQLDDVSEALARVQAERENLEKEQELRMQELLMETDRQASKKVAEAKEQQEKEMQEKMAALEHEAKAEQAKLQLAFEEKMAAMEEANRKEKLERERIAEEKAKLAAEKEALNAIAQEKQSLEALRTEELSKKEEEMSMKETLLAKERAQKNEAMAELALLKAQLAQAKREQETASQDAAHRAEEERKAKKEEEAAAARAPENATTERDRLLSEFEERRKELEAQQKQEQDRQERLLNELLEIKRKKREAKQAKKAEGAEATS